MDLEKESSTIGSVNLEDDLERTLGELFEVVSALEAQPNNIPLLRRNVDLTKQAHMSEETQQALEMLVAVVGCPPCEWEARGRSLTHAQYLSPPLDLYLP